MDGTQHDSRSNFDTDAMRRDLDAATENGKRLAPIDKQFGDGLPYQRDRIVNEARWFMAEAAQSALEVGRRLILLKEHEAHGDFQTAVEQIGLAPRAAQRMMQAAVKFAKTPQLANLGKSKMLELLTEEDDDIEALAEGGTLAGHTLDEIDRMTRRELRDALRKAKQKADDDAEVSERMLADKNAKIDDLDRKLDRERSRTRPWPETAREIGLQIEKRRDEALAALDALDQLRRAIHTERFGEEGDNDKAVASVAVVYCNAIDYIIESVAEADQTCDDDFGGYRDRAKPLLRVDALQPGNDADELPPEALQGDYLPPNESGTGPAESGSQHH